jgi:hypothetical protein
MKSVNILCFHFVAVDGFRKTAMALLETVSFLELVTVTNSMLSATVSSHFVKLTDTQAVMKIPNFYKNQRCITVFLRACHWSVP